VADGTFREDLFYRLSVIRIHVPPLRERREEIPHLSTFFLREASERLGKPGVRLSAETLDLFDSFQWPGNVRQLRNEVQRAVAMALPGGLIKPDLLSPVFSAAFERTTDTVMRGLGRKASLSSAVESLERDLIEGALEQAAGNISETARSLGLTRRGLYLKMQRLGVSAARL
jgi:DNA-binding NtrC family response regulator